jgi:undecaprenyl-diphosphatase
LAGILQRLIEFDQALFLFLNDFHSPEWDTVFSLISAKLIWVPLYLFIYFRLLKTYGFAQWWTLLLAIGLTIFLSDFVASGVFKPFFQRLRPCYEPHLEAWVHVPDGCGGRYGFASSHASNAFATAMFAYLSMGRLGQFWRKAWINWKLLFAWAALVSYSRIYLGVHYPADLLMGGIIGVTAAYIGHYFFTCFAGCKLPIRS